MPDHRNKPGDDNSGGRKPGGKGPRPGGFRPGGAGHGSGPGGFQGRGGPRPGGDRPEGGRFEGPRSFDRPGGGFSGPRPGGDRPGGGFSGPRPGGFGPGGPRAGGGFSGPRPGGDRPSFGTGPRPGGFSGPRPGGFGPGGSRSGGDRPGFGPGPRPGGFSPRPGGPRPGGFRPGPRPDFDNGAPNWDGDAPRAPRREWQSNDAWTPPSPRQFDAPGSGERSDSGDAPRFGAGPRYGAGRPPGRQTFGSRPGFGPRPGAPRHESFQPRREDFAPDDKAGQSRPSRYDDQGEGGFAGPRRGPGQRPGPGLRPSFGNRRGPAPRPGFRPASGPRPGFGEGPGPRRAPFDGPRPDEASYRDESFGDAPEQLLDASEGFTPSVADEPAADPSIEATEGGPARGDEPAEDRRPAAPRPFRPGPRPDYRARSGGYGDRRGFAAGGPSTPWSRPAASPPPAGLLGEDEELVAGRHPVEEAFIAHRKAIRLLVVPQRRLALEKLVLHATNLRIPIVEVEGGTLTQLAGFDGHQGIALVTDKRQFAGLDDILARAIERGEAPFVLVLDSLEDPQNFGSLLRTAEASGVHGVIYPVRRQAPLSSAAVKASAGAVEHLLLVPVEDLAESLTDLHVRGLRVIGSDADAPLTARQADLRGPVVIVVGSEGQGLGPAVRRRCDAVVRIPMRGRVTSLNAAVAGSILLYEASSQRGGDRPIVGPEPGTGDEIASIRGLAGEDETESGWTPGADATADATAATADATAEALVEELAGAADELSVAQDQAAAGAELPAARKPRAKRKAKVQPEPTPAAADTEEDALLPGSSVIDSNDAATAE